MCLGSIRSVRSPIFTMSKISFSSAKELLDDPLSCFKLITDTRNLKLSPKYIGDVGSGIREQLDAYLNLYSHSLGGVMIAYSNIHRQRSYGTIVGCQPCIHIGIQADFIVFKPEMGSTLKGVVNKVFRSHIGCLVHNTFNASVPKQCRDGESLLETNLEPGQEILFKVVKTSAQNGVLSMIGCFFGDSFDLIASSQLNDTGVQDRDELDSHILAGNVEDLPTIKHRKTDRKSCFELSVDDNMAEATGQEDTSYEQMETSHTETFGSEKKKKKKKKKHREESTDEIVSGGKDDSIDNLSKESLVDSGFVQQMPVPLDIDRKKKKKKKHKIKDTDQAELENMTSFQDTCQPGEETDCSTKKKKKKKAKEREVTLDGFDGSQNGTDRNKITKKRKRADSDQMEEESMMISDQETSKPGEVCEGSPKKKKRKKHKERKDTLDSPGGNHDVSGMGVKIQNAESTDKILDTNCDDEHNAAASQGSTKKKKKKRHKHSD